MVWTIVSCGYIEHEGLRKRDIQGGHEKDRPERDDFAEPRLILIRTDILPRRP